MRTLLEITEAARSGEMPTHDECFWAMLRLDYLLVSHAHLLNEVAAKKKTPESLAIRAEAMFQNRKAAFAIDPKTGVGPEYDPFNPEVQKRRALSKRIFEQATGEKL